MISKIHTTLVHVTVNLVSYVVGCYIKPYDVAAYVINIVFYVAPYDIRYDVDNVCIDAARAMSSYLLILVNTLISFLMNCGYCH